MGKRTPTKASKPRRKRASRSENHQIGGGGSVELHPKRSEFSAATKRAAWKRCGGACEGEIFQPRTILHAGSYFSTGLRLERCNASIDVGCFHYDHVIPTWMSQDNSLGNCQVLCLQCHSAKTKCDVKQIAKSKRIIRGKPKSKHPIKSRGFTGWRKFDGSIVHR